MTDVLDQLHLYLVSIGHQHWWRGSIDMGGRRWGVRDYGTWIDAYTWGRSAKCHSLEEVLAVIGEVL